MYYYYILLYTVWQQKRHAHAVLHSAVAMYWQYYMRDVCMYTYYYMVLLLHCMYVCMYASTYYYTVQCKRVCMYTCTCIHILLSYYVQQQGSSLLLYIILVCLLVCTIMMYTCIHPVVLTVHQQYHHHVVLTTMDDTVHMMYVCMSLHTTTSYVQGLRVRATSNQQLSNQYVHTSRRKRGRVVLHCMYVCIHTTTRYYTLLHVVQERVCVYHYNTLSVSMYTS